MPLEGQQDLNTARRQGQPRMYQLCDDYIEGRLFFIPN